MRFITRLRPSAPMAVAMVALVAAISTVAIADPIATKSVSKKQIKSIAKRQANKQITSRANGLTVGKAKGLTQAGIQSLASSFQGKARWAFVMADGTIAAQTGGISIVNHTVGSDYVNFGSPVNRKPKLVVGYNASAVGFTCGGATSTTNPDGSACAANNNFNHVFVPKGGGINAYLVMVFV